MERVRESLRSPLTPPHRAGNPLRPREFRRARSTFDSDCAAQRAGGGRASAARHHHGAHLAARPRPGARRDAHPLGAPRGGDRGHDHPRRRARTRAAQDRRAQRQALRGRRAHSQPRARTRARARGVSHGRSREGRRHAARPALAAHRQQRAELALRGVPPGVEASAHPRHPHTHALAHAPLHRRPARTARSCRGPGRHRHRERAALRRGAAPRDHRRAHGPREPSSLSRTRRGGLRVGRASAVGRDDRRRPLQDGQRRARSPRGRCGAHRRGRTHPRGAPRGRAARTLRRRRVRRAAPRDRRGRGAACCRDRVRAG